MSFCDNLLEVLALPSKITLVLVVVLVFLMTAWCGRKSHSCLVFWVFMCFMCPRSSYSFINLWYCTLRSGCFSSLHSIACSLRSAERRENPSHLGSIFLGSLTTNLPSCCWTVLEMKCCSQACCSAVMEDCYMGSTSQKRCKLFSSLLSSRSNNCVINHCDEMTGVVPDSVQVSIVSWSRG